MKNSVEIMLPDVDYGVGVIDFVAAKLCKIDMPSDEEELDVDLTKLCLTLKHPNKKLLAKTKLRMEQLIFNSPRVKRLIS